MTKHRNGRPAIDITGRRFGRLVALERFSNPPQRAKWLCLCDCGNQKWIAFSPLMRGASTSCGCYRSEWATTHKKTHGYSKDPTYACWHHAKQRCTNPRNPSYQYYGARGITMCERWFHSFANFLADMGPRPHPNLTLDRIDNDKGYSPDNCRWATYADQLNNQRRYQPKKRQVPQEILDAIRAH